MNKTELITAVAAGAGLTKNQAAAAVEAFVAAAEDTVAGGDKLSLLGFGTFEPKSYKKTTARNPRTGEKVTVPAKTVPVFKAGKSFKEKVNK